MPPISTHLHFGKKLIENSTDEVDIRCFILGMVSPDTYDDDTFEEIHNLDEDGNLDIREFYEQFDFKKLNLQEKSYVLGYYCYLWFDEYYKFNASKLKINNYYDLPDNELAIAIKDLFRFYDSKAIGSFYDGIIRDINSYKLNINLKEIKNINIQKVKDKLLEYSKEKVPNEVYSYLINEDKYMNFIQKGCSKIVKSL
ncbi:MAG: hypothetical protein PHE29_12585 [Tissierellia bacterium]|nr:hypothetical protein [Tissierellia bacterium]